MCLGKYVRTKNRSEIQNVGYVPADRPFATVGVKFGLQGAGPTRMRGEGTQSMYYDENRNGGKSSLESLVKNRSVFQLAIFLVPSLQYIIVPLYRVKSIDILSLIIEALRVWPIKPF